MIYIIVAIIIAVALIYLLAVDWLVRYAYDRKSPKLPKVISQGVMGKKVNKNNGKSKSRERAENLKNVASQKFEITSFDGIKLVAHYYPSNNPKRVIIACHGWRSSWNYDFNGPAEFLHKDSSMLFVELRAHGESEGRYVYYGKKERFDIAKWSDFVKENISDSLPIYIYGMSIGAMSSIMSTASGINKNVVGVIADSAPDNARNVGHTVIKNIHLNPKIIYPIIRFDSRLRIKMDDNDYTANEALKSNSVPILFIHGTNDKVADIKYMREMFSQCKAPKMEFVVNGAGHMKSYYVDENGYQLKLNEFFSMCENNKN